MDQSFDTSSLTLEQAAALVATQAQLGIARNGLEKQAYGWGDMSPAVQSALVGGGLGLGTGLLASMRRKRGDKQWLRNAIMGSLLGAGVGGAAGYGYSQLNAAGGKDKGSLEYYADQMREAAEPQGEGQEQNSEGFWKLGPLGSWLLGSKPFDPSSIQDPDQRAKFEEGQKGYIEGGGDMNALDLPAGGPGIADRVGNLPRAAEYGVAGGMAGRLYDKIRARMPSPSELAKAAPATPMEMKQFASSHAGEAASLLAPGEAGKTLAGELAAAAPSVTATTIPARRTTGIPFRGRRIGANIPIPFTGKTVRTPTFTGANGPLPLTSTQLEGIEGGVRAARPPGTPRKPSNRGMWLGAGLTALYGLATGQGGNSQPQKWNPVIKAPQ